MTSHYVFKRFAVRFFSVLSLTGLSACGTASYWSGLTHPNKEWVEQPARSIENQDLIFVNSAVDPARSRAEFNAVSKALEDLANECSFIPKGTHLEDRADTQNPDGFVVSVKLVIADKLCEQAKKDLIPEIIKRNANRGYAEQLQKYQLENRSGFNDKRLSRREANLIHDDIEFFEMRQKIALLKTDIILPSKNHDEVGLKHSQEVLQILSEEFAATHNYEVANPTLKSSSLTWSKVQIQISQNLKMQNSAQSQSLTHKNLSKAKQAQRKPAQTSVKTDLEAVKK